MYNEEEDAKKIYENGFRNKEYNFYETVLVAKHFRYVMGYGDAKIKTVLKEFCITNDKFWNDVLNLRNIKSAVSKSRKPFVNKSNPIPIYKDEIDAITSVEGYKQKKVLFAIFVLAKINNGYIYNNEWNKIRRVLHSKITNKNIFELIEYYASRNLLYATKNLYHKILFINLQGTLVFTVSSESINNLKKVFEDVFGKDLFVCVDCKKTYERRSYNQKRCKECSQIHKKELWRLQKIRQRNKMSAY